LAAVIGPDQLGRANGLENVSHVINSDDEAIFNEAEAGKQLNHE